MLAEMISYCDISSFSRQNTVVNGELTRGHLFFLLLPSGTLTLVLTSPDSTRYVNQTLQYILISLRLKSMY